MAEFKDGFSIEVTDVVRLNFTYKGGSRVDDAIVLSLANADALARLLLEEMAGDKKVKRVG